MTSINSQTRRVFTSASAPEPKLEKFGGDPMKYQYFINMFETVVEVRVKNVRE